MHDIWNPWHGCVKYSEGCMNCYMYVLDKMRNQDGSHIYKTNDFAYPLSRNRDGTYKIQSGEKIRVCMTSDFCLEEAEVLITFEKKPSQEEADICYSKLAINNDYDAFWNKVYSYADENIKR